MDGAIVKTIPGVLKVGNFLNPGTTLKRYPDKKKHLPIKNANAKITTSDLFLSLDNLNAQAVNNGTNIALYSNVFLKILFKVLIVLLSLFKIGFDCAVKTLTTETDKTLNNINIAIHDTNVTNKLILLS